MSDNAVYGQPQVVESNSASASAVLTDHDNDGFRLAVTCDDQLDSDVTVRVPVPEGWHRFSVIQGTDGNGTSSRIYEAISIDDQRFAECEIRPNVVAAVVKRLGFRIANDSGYSGPVLQDSASPTLTVLEERGDTQFLDVQAGHYYELQLPEPDGVAVGTRYEGGKARNSLLSPMFQSRFIVKLDDLGDWHLEGFQLFCATAEAHGGKANMGINPGNCGPPVWDWLRSQDRDQFDLWNHSWDHGSHDRGLKYHGLPYDVQFYHHELTQEKVKRELGYTMRAYGLPGTKPYPDAPFGDWLGDWDAVTYYAARNHPDIKVVFSAMEWQSDRGVNQINSEDMLTLNDVNNFEWDVWEWGPAPPEGDRRLLDLYPDVDPIRPSTRGNGEELIWRLHHPYRKPDSGDRWDAMFAQIHPYRVYMEDEHQQAFAQLFDHIRDSDGWRCATVWETYRWFLDRDLIAVEKTAPDRYRIEAQRLHYDHRMELDVPAGTVADGRAYHIHAYPDR